jgi:hypothetical protein
MSLIDLLKKRGPVRYNPNTSDDPDEFKVLKGYKKLKFNFGLGKRKTIWADPANFTDERSMRAYYRA